MSDQGFFDFRERLTQRSEPAPAKEKSPPSPPLTVSQLTNKIEAAIRTQLPGSVLVQGEVSNFRAIAAGHFFFKIKDSDDSIECTMWRSDNLKLKFEVRDGMQVIIGGTVGLHRQQSQYRVYVKKLEPHGEGALELAFQQLRQKLQKEGLFDPKRKKPIPPYPTRIALITSAQAAALQDMLKILRRFPFLRVMVYPTLVQGQDAGGKIAATIDHLNRCHQQIGGVDVILLARGGGSLEDLWAFNEEVVARAVAASKLPIITGIGHEVDVCIADLVADHHAHTPTEAAQVVTHFWRDAGELVTRQASRLHRELRQLISHAEQRLAGAERHEVFRTPLQRIHRLVERLSDLRRQLVSGTDQRVAQSHRLLAQLESRLQQQRTQIVTRLREQVSELRRFLAAVMQNQLQRLRGRLQRNQVLLRDSHPKHRLQLSTQRLGQADNRMRRTMTQDMRRRQQQVDSMSARLEAINPKRVLQRGYSLTTLRKSGAVIRNAADLRSGDRLLTHFAIGEVDSVVEPDDNRP
jgi:exodeoxyribonuclease VII large subunit